MPSSDNNFYTDASSSNTSWCAWYPSSSCYYCGHDPAGCQGTAVGYSYTLIEQWSDGVTAGLAATVLSIISWRLYSSFYTKYDHSDEAERRVTQAVYFTVAARQEAMWRSPAESAYSSPRNNQEEIVVDAGSRSCSVCGLDLVDASSLRRHLRDYHKRVRAKYLERKAARGSLSSSGPLSASRLIDDAVMITESDTLDGWILASVERVSGGLAARLQVRVYVADDPRGSGALDAQAYNRLGRTLEQQRVFDQMEPLAVLSLAMNPSFVLSRVN
ncbi:hypothetical protein V1509DRAFT_649214 [Lipomyces kononenkoae]